MSWLGRSNEYEMVSALPSLSVRMVTALGECVISSRTGIRGESFEACAADSLRVMSITHVPLKFAPSCACAQSPMPTTTTAAAANILRAMTHLLGACQRRHRSLRRSVTCKWLADYDRLSRLTSCSAMARHGSANSTLLRSRDQRPGIEPDVDFDQHVGET